MTPETVRRYSAPVPRYTSYPTAPNFSPRVGAPAYCDWLRRLPQGTALSLYVHIPFCERLCWYCGCNTKATRRYEPVAAYLEALSIEFGNVAALIPKGAHVANVHWGGGTPNVLSAADIRGLAGAMQAVFEVDERAGFAVEIDPRRLGVDQADAFVAAGVNRVSIGVQDFDPAVQHAINRVQDFETTQRAVNLFRDRGINSINIDLNYGLPHQSRGSTERTIEKVLALAPDRIAAFGYAHLPDRLRHQRLIDSEALPDVTERFAQSQRIARKLESAGFVRVGLDHYARPDDPLAQAGARRNFQGYTTDNSQALIGLGASAIGRLPEGYVQNAPSTSEYSMLVRRDGFATVRGIELTADDRVRAAAIERLMCSFDFSGSDLIGSFGVAASPLLDVANHLISSDRDGFIESTSDGFRMTPKGRPFVRTICACFDAYFGMTPERHALAV